MLSVMAVYCYVERNVRVSDWVTEGVREER